MKGTLALEFIGATTHDRIKDFERTLETLGYKTDPEDRVRGGPWVAEVKRHPDGDFKLDFLHGKRDYSKANSKGTRFVYVHYVLEQDRLYWVQSPQSWRSTIRYYAAVTPSGDVRRLTDEEAQEWLNAL